MIATDGRVRVAEEAKQRLIVIYVDRDDDIGRTLGIKTPIVGRDENLRAATRFALQAPEDSDANALFAAIQVYDKLREDKGVECEVATVAGDFEGGVKADLKVSKEIDEVLKRFPAEGAIVVSDGASDEHVIPIIQSKVPITSIRRVVVRQSRGIEETYFLIVKYLRRIMEDPKYSTYMVGLPGIFLVMVAILASLGLAHYAGVALLFLIGVTLIVKGFSIDRMLLSAWSSSPIIFSSALISIVTFTVAAYLGAAAVSSFLASEGPVTLLELPKLIGVFLSLPNMPVFLAKIYNVDIIMAGFIILLLGRAVDKYISGRPRVWHEGLTIIFCIMLTLLLREVANLLLNPLQTPLTFLVWMLMTVLVYGALLIAFMFYERWKREV
ncbi:MAG: hypothetical protein DRJ97_04035 [Thermoprotei archaeon]|nr:MAG: hypothetical protein DRJ97_04035 [Thermoprotei archaeon]